MGWDRIWQEPHENGILDFFLGFMLALSVYHTIIYTKNKDKLFLYYGIYTLFIFFSNVNQVRTGFVLDLISSIKPVIASLPELFNETYYSIYFLFAYSFLDMDKEFPRRNKWILSSVYLVFGVCVFLYVLYLFTGNRQITGEGYYYFVIIISILGLLTYIPFFKSTHPLKNYIIIGSIIMFVCSVTSLIHFVHLGRAGEDHQSAFTILYLGLGFENVLFALGLGQKQWLLQQEKSRTQQRLIFQLKENEKLKNSVQDKLEADLKMLSEQVEQDKLDRLKVMYDRQIADMHLSSLRAQMNPHFLFNSLNSIKLYIIENEKEQAVYYLNKFSKLIRMILSATREKEQTLHTELETMELYTQIENIRFHNQIEVRFVVSPQVQVHQIKLPPLILQPFYENAIWHGLSSKTGKQKLVTTVLCSDSAYVEIVIEDNGIGRSKSRENKAKRVYKQNSVGLKLTEERLELYCRDKALPYELSIHDLENADGEALGTRVHLRYPLS